MTKKYINFHPGTTAEPREVSVGEVSAYGMCDLEEFVTCVFQGFTASTYLDGAKDALEDGEYLGKILDVQIGLDDEALEDTVAEIHAALP